MRAKACSKERLKDHLAKHNCDVFISLNDFYYPLGGKAERFVCLFLFFFFFYVHDIMNFLGWWDLRP